MNQTTYILIHLSSFAQYYVCESDSYTVHLSSCCLVFHYVIIHNLFILLSMDSWVRFPFLAITKYAAMNILEHVYW